MYNKTYKNCFVKIFMSGIEDLNERDKNLMYNELQKLLVWRLPSKKFFYGDYESKGKPSFLKRLYCTFLE